MPAFLQRYSFMEVTGQASDHQGKGFYGPKHDLSQYLYRSRLDDCDAQDLRNADRPDRRNKPSIANHVPVLPLHHRQVKSKLLAMWKAIARRMNLRPGLPSLAYSCFADMQCS
jgi:hypothetical protein